MRGNRGPGLGGLAAGAAGLTLLAVGWLAIPALPPLPVGVAFVAVFAALALLIASQVTSRKTTGPSTRRRSALISAGVMGGVLVALAITVSVTGPHPWPAGQPTIVDGSYFLNSHGTLIPITGAEYRKDLKAVIAAFLCFSALLDLAALATLGLATGKSAPHSG
ncbi:hypothetical protein AB0J83_22110 [Actinoplanes sp. NPDC049596]|uniref:hypothetical protein n=1 Tax=unclassified Actinoplanes TaxID=2626549 RepID=UPI0034348452